MLFNPKLDGVFHLHDTDRARTGSILNGFLTFLTSRDHLDIFVGQSSPSFPVLTVYFQSCQLSVQIFHILRCVVNPSPSRPPLLPFPGTTRKRSFQRIKKSICTLFGGHPALTCHPNAVATMDSWLSSENGSHQTTRVQMEREFSRRIGANRRIVEKVA